MLIYSSKRFIGTMPMLLKISCLLLLQIWLFLAQDIQVSKSVSHWPLLLWRLLLRILDELVGVEVTPNQEISLQGKVQCICYSTSHMGHVDIKHQLFQ